MAIGRRRRAPQQELFVATSDIRALDNPFYRALNGLLEEHGFDEFSEEQCREFYAGNRGRPGVPPGVYFRMLVDRLLQRGAPALVAGRADTGRGLSRKHGGVVRTIRRDATHGAQPAQRRLRAWRDCRAPVPSVFPSEASPDGKTEVIFKPGSEESVRTGWLGTPAFPGRTCSRRAQARSPRAFATIGIHLRIALGLSNEVGPLQTATAPTSMPRSSVGSPLGHASISISLPPTPPWLNQVGICSISSPRKP